MLDKFWFKVDVAIRACFVIKIENKRKKKSLSENDILDILIKSILK